MGKEVTLGGDRLGSGKKQKVYLKGYERSTHDLSYVWRSSMAAGTLVPFMNEVGLPGDTFDIELDIDVKTLPTVGPLFGSYKIQLDIFKCPIRLYNNLLHNNRLGIGNNMSEATLPILKINVKPVKNIELEVDNVDNFQVNPSCILSYLGIRGYGITQNALDRTFNGVPLLAYWDIYKNYYANKQEEIGAVIHSNNTIGVTNNIDQFQINGNTNDIIEYPSISNQQNPPILANSTIYIHCTGTPPSVDDVMMWIDTIGWITLRQYSIVGSIVINTVTNEIWAIVNPLYAGLWVRNYTYADILNGSVRNIQVETFPLHNIDAMRDRILKADTNPFNVYATDIIPYKYLDDIDGNGNYVTSNIQEGLAIKTFQSDLFNNWLQTTWIDEITAATAVSVVSNKFNIDQLILARKVYEMLTRIAVSGGSYDDWIEAVYDTKVYGKTENPIYEGGLIKELVFQEVVSNSATATEPLGTLAGRGVMAGKHKGGKVTIKVDEHCYIMGIISLTPRIDYSQGNRWDVHLKTMDDFHKPQLDEIGFQDLITEQMAWWSTYEESGTWVQQSAGKQPAWINYMTNYNRTYGNFAIRNQEMFMTLNRRYESNENPVVPSIVDLTTYIDPAKFNFIFAETRLDAQNFWVQIGNRITARRKMSAKVMPNL